MTDKNSSHHLNEFGLIDYKKPLGKQQDMRTSNYLGHILMDDTMLGHATRPRCHATKPYEEDPVLNKHKTTNYRNSFVWQFGNPEEIRNVSLEEKIMHMKPFYDCNLKFIERQIRPSTSVSHSDYVWQPTICPLPPQRGDIPAPVCHSKVIVERNKPGYSKYLDPAATTTSLDYCYRSPKDVMNSIAAKDNITFWNWKDIEHRDQKVFRAKDAQLCDKLQSKDCPKRRSEFPTKVRAVPNAGLSTEVRENYIKPSERTLVFNQPKLKNILTFVASEPTADTTEYQVLGSGETSQKLL